MADDRVTVYRFDFGPGCLAAAESLAIALRDRGGLSPVVVLGMDYATVTLPASELPALDELRRKHPELFGGC